MHALFGTNLFHDNIVITKLHFQCLYFLTQGFLPTHKSYKQIWAHIQAMME
jgi:hypothetical protein